METIAGYVLVGGKSSRLGRDKALLPVEGQPLALRVAAAVRSSAGNVTLVGPPEKYRHLGLRVIPDAVENFGPVGGLLAALEDTGADWILATACDLPHLTSEFLRFLLQQAMTTDADIILPRDRKGRDEPLCAVYRAVCHETIRQAVQDGIHKVTRAFGDLRVHHLEARDYGDFDSDGRLFANLNTTADLAEEGLSTSWQEP